MKKLWILGLLLLPFAAGCSSLWHKAATTEVPRLDENGRPEAMDKIQGKLGGDYVIVPRAFLESGATTPTPTTAPTAAKKPAVRPAVTSNTAATTRPAAQPTTTPAQDDKMRISWDGASRIRIRCAQKFGKADVFPKRGGDWSVDEPPDITDDGYIDPSVVGPIIEKVRKSNQARLAANPNLRKDQLAYVCFNFHTPLGDRHTEHLTKDGNWAMVAPDSAEPGERIVLTGGVNIAGEIANTDENGHEAGDRIHCFAVIPH